MEKIDLIEQGSFADFLNHALTIEFVDPYRSSFNESNLLIIVL
jgi:hypothetical protein